MKLDLVERQEPAILSAAQTESLRPALEWLVERKIIGVATNGHYTVVTPRNFVGHVVMGDARIEIRPRDPQAFAAIREFLSVMPGKAVAAGEGEGDDTERDVALEYLHLLENLLSTGLPVEYRLSRRTGSTPTGPIDFTRTVQQHIAKGVWHLVSYRHTDRVTDARLSAILLGAGEALDASYRLLHLKPAQRLRFDAALDVLPDGLELAPAEVDPAADELLARFAERPEVVGVVDLARQILLDDLGVTYGATSNGLKTRFYDTDALWELVTRVVLAQAVKSVPTASVELHPLRTSGMSLLTDGGPTIDPDVVAYAGPSARVVADAKNSLASTPSAGDVYQLFAYSSRIGARIGILVYKSPGEFWATILGGFKGDMLFAAVGLDARNLGTAASSLAAALPPLADELQVVPA